MGNDHELLQAMRELTVALKEVTVELKSARWAGGLPADGRRRPLTIPEAAERMNVPESTVQRLIVTGRLESTRPGRRYLVTEEAIEKCLANASTVAPPHRRRRRRI